MDNEKIFLSSVEKRLGYLYGESVKRYKTLDFFAEDTVTASGVLSLKFIAERNACARLDIGYSGTGEAAFYVNGTLYDKITSSGSASAVIEAYLSAGENELSVDISGVANFAFVRCTISGYIKRKNSGSKIYSANCGNSSLLTFFNGVRSHADVKISAASETPVLSLSCRGIALSQVSPDKFVAASLCADHIDLYLIDMTYSDVTLSSRISLSGVHAISGAAGGELFVVTSDKKLKKYVIAEDLTFTATDVGIRVNEVISSPQCPFVVLVCPDGKAYLVNLA